MSMKRTSSTDRCFPCKTMGMYKPRTHWIEPGPPWMCLDISPIRPGRGKTTGKRCRMIWGRGGGEVAGRRVNGQVGRRRERRVDDDGWASWSTERNGAGQTASKTTDALCSGDWHPTLSGNQVRSPRIEWRLWLCTHRADQCVRPRRGLQNMVRRIFSGYRRDPLVTEFLHELGITIPPYLDTKQRARLKPPKQFAPYIVVTDDACRSRRDSLLFIRVTVYNLL